MTQPTHPTLERAPMIGDAVGHYRLVGALGDGSLGHLYLAEQRGIRGVSKTVALRCIRPELAQSSDFRALFSDAVSIAPRFEHPNVVTIYELGEVDGHCFFSMEYLAGESVASILSRGDTGAQLPSDIAAAVVKQAANAVQYLHDLRAAAARPVALGHGEVNPSNIFVTYHGMVKLLGVGLRPIRVTNDAAVSGARRVGSSSEASAYLAPEQLESGADPRTDIFSLGAVLWTCLTGQKPQPAPGSDEVDAAAPSLPRVAPSTVRADVPEALDSIAMRALSADPLERFQSAREMSEALERYLVRGDSRPTPKHIRRWMEQAFDAERASLQLQIAQGRDVEGALSLLGALQPGGVGANVAHLRASVRPRELWSTSHSVFSRLERGSMIPPRSFGAGPGSAPHERLSVSSMLPRQLPSTSTGAPSLPASGQPSTTAPRAAPARTWLVALLMATCAIIALGTAAILSSSNESSPFRAAPRGSQLPDPGGRVEVRSTPEGAAIFIDGEPTGLRTPAVLKGLADGRSLQLRVDKAGFASQNREIQIVGGSSQAHSFELLASDGLVHIAGAPADARIYIDEKPVAVDDGEPVSLSVGQHTLRVETPSSLIFSGTVAIVAGEQTIRVDDVEATP